VAALLLNLVVPGSGLILRRREWLGVALAGLFGMAVNVALGGWLLAPMAIPGWIKWSAAAIAVCAWALAQSLFLSQSAAT
jgi:hypothetical protein